MFDYFKECKNSENLEKFWKSKADDISWSKSPTIIYNNDFKNSKWFADGFLNACYNCVDRHVESTPSKIGIIFDDNSGKTFKFTYKEILDRVLIVGNILKKHLEFGDCATIYMSMCPEAIFTMLACARLGIIHNVVFGGFSSESLRMRIEDSKSKMVITSDVIRRGEKEIRLIDTVRTAIEGFGNVKILVFDSEKPEEDSFIYYSKIEKSVEFFKCVDVESEHPLFYLYTSGSTGRPKGLIHSTGGYLLYAQYTTKAAFNIEEKDIFFCTADIGWITGHTYATYGPLCLGITTVILEGLPTYPSHERFFEMVEKYKITQLYTAPTTIRILKKYFESNNDPEQISSAIFENQNNNFEKYDLSSLKLLGSVGEPLNEEAYKWFSSSFGNLHIVDCYWQTETGGVMIASFSNARPCKPECAGMAMPGICPMVIPEENLETTKSSSSDKTNNDSNSHLNKSHNSSLGKIYISNSWPGIARSILNDPSRYYSSYFSSGMYFTGDEGICDKDSNIWILGRADDVINVSGHRISTAEVESAACADSYVAESAVIAGPHKIKGVCIILFVVLKNSSHSNEDILRNKAEALEMAIQDQNIQENKAESIRIESGVFDQNNEKITNSILSTITQKIGGFARPESVIIVEGIPKTATGKIIRRVLRNIVYGENYGDLSTCVNKEVVDNVQSTYTREISRLVNNLP